MKKQLLNNQILISGQNNITFNNSFYTFLAKWFFTSSSKTVAILYFIFVFFAATLGTIFSFLIRLELKLILIFFYFFFLQ